MTEAIVKVLPKIGKHQPMNAAAELMDGARPKLEELVRRFEYASGSRMRATEDVGSLIGRSGSWVRKLIGRRLDTKRPDAVPLLAIHALYSRICGAIEADARRREENAAVASNHQMDQGVVRRTPYAPPLADDQISELLNIPKT